MNLLRLLVAASLLAVFGQSGWATAQQVQPMAARQAPPLTIERVFDSPSLSGPVPRLPKLSHDGRYLALLRNRPNDLDRYDLWVFDRNTGKWSMLVDSEKLGSGQTMSEAEKMQRERKSDLDQAFGAFSARWASVSAPCPPATSRWTVRRSAMRAAFPVRPRR